MAKKARKGPSKSQMIREYLAANPGDGPKDVVAALNSAHGWNLSPQFVSTVKSTAKRNKKKRGRQPGRPVGSTTTSSGGGKVSMESLMAAKKLVKDLGGVDKAKAAIDSLAKLLG